jgi:hypothetical protein
MACKTIEEIPALDASQRRCRAIRPSRLRQDSFYADGPTRTFEPIGCLVSSSLDVPFTGVSKSMGQI